MVRVLPVIVNLAVDRISLELLPVLTSTEPGSRTNIAREAGVAERGGVSVAQLRSRRPAGPAGESLPASAILNAGNPQAQTIPHERRRSGGR